MAAFGNFPNHIQLFIFCWPAGIGVTQFFKGLRASENPNIHKALFDTLHTLRSLGLFLFGGGGFSLEEKYCQ
jgi:hypothetical protein